MLTLQLSSRGTSLCYSNTYPGDYKQWGCGSSDWATNVATSYFGMAEDVSLQIVTTGSGSGSSTVSENAFPSSAFPSLVSQASTLVTSSSLTSQATSAAPASASESQGSAQTTTSSSVPSASFAAGNTTSTSKSTKSTIPIAGVAGSVVGGIGVIALIAGLCIFGRRRGWFDKNSHRRSIQLRSNNPSTQTLAQHQNVPMTQVSKNHVPEYATPGAYQTRVDASLAPPRWDKRGVLITDPPAETKKELHPAERPSGSTAAKKTSKSRTTTSSGASTKGRSKAKSSSSSATGVKKSRKAPRSTSAGVSSSQ